MSDTYDAVYSAVRSRISSCDVGEAIRSACSLDASHAIALIQQDFCIAAGEMQRPSVLYRPTVFPDGGKWCALYGKDLQMGVAGFGDSPAQAMAAFDVAWSTCSAPQNEVSK
jgi:hypothetical protein